MSTPEATSGPLILRDKILGWLETEGYPLEFRTASAFSRCGFNTWQGYYVREPASADARKIDVMADMTLRLGKGSFFRVSQVVECKWSKDKPWVIFTNQGSSMTESACIAQSIGSVLGEAVMFLAASETNLYSQTFAPIKRGGFSGRRAFENQGNHDKQDRFYNAIQGLVWKAVAEAKSWNDPNPGSRGAPNSGVVVFPVMVVDGDLFEAYYDQEADAVCKCEQS
jgi:hypothetical protein